MSTMSINQLTNMLPFIWAFFDQTAVWFKNVFDEKFVEFSSWAL